MVRVEIDSGAGPGGHGSRVEDLALPVAGFIVGAGVDQDLIRLASHADYDLVASAVVQIGGQDGVSVEERIVDHFAAPLAAMVGIDDDFIAVPGLDGGEEALLAG